jgi:hypothetical protein
MAGQGSETIPRHRQPTASSAARFREPKGSSSVKPAEGVQKPTASPAARFREPTASSSAKQVEGVKRPTAGRPKRVQTPHPRALARVMSDSSEGSAESSNTSPNTSPQSTPAYRAPTVASSSRSRATSNSSISSGSSTRTPSASLPPSTQKSEAAPAKNTLSNHLEAMAGRFQASAQARQTNVDGDKATRLSGHLAGMAAAFQAAQTPSFARPTAASAARVTAPQAPILKKSQGVSSRNPSVGCLSRLYAGERRLKPPCKAERAVRLVGYAVSDGVEKLKRLNPWRKPRVTKCSHQRTVDWDDEEEWDYWVIPRDKTKDDVWRTRELTKRNLWREGVENMYLWWHKDKW